MRVREGRHLGLCIGLAWPTCWPLSATILCWVVALPALARSLDERFVDGLRERQLLSLAEKFCRDRLARPNLPESRRAELSIELSRCLTDDALQTSPAARDDLWRQALDVVDQFAKQFPNSGRLVQVRVQRGLVQLAWGEQLAQQAEAAGAGADRLSAARDHLRSAIDELRKAAAKSAEMQRRLQTGQKVGAGELTLGELLARKEHRVSTRPRFAPAG